MSRLHDLVVEIGPCKEAAHCNNSPLNPGIVRCADCRLSPGGGSQSYWWPSPASAKHPVLVAERLQKKRSVVLERTAKRANRDPVRRRIQKLAAQAEQTTNRNIIRATVNSGRSNQDADHVHAGRITLDTKLQITRVNPLVHLAELDKVRADSKRAGMLLGALVIRNRNGRGVVVVDEEDYVKLVKV